MNRARQWTAREDQIILKVRPRTAFKRLGGKRSLGAIRLRRHKLLHPSRAVPTGPKLWNQEELQILRDRYPTAEKTAELLPLLPRFNEEDIRAKASRLKVKRRFVGDRDVPVGGHRELVDQIRMRAKEDGIGLVKLDKLCGTRGYFRYNWKRRQWVNLLAVARALEFFGGTLVIDWCDR